MDTILAWHFTGVDAAGRPVLRDWQPVPPCGVGLEHAGPVVMCTSGLHASRDILDALSYSPGCWLHRVECAGIEVEEADKLVCRRRRVVASADMTWALVTWAEWCAGRADDASAASRDAAIYARNARNAASDAARDAREAAGYAAIYAGYARYARYAASYASTERVWQVETLEMLFSALVAGL